MEKVEELESFLKRATSENARNNLVDQGIAWSIMRVDGTYNGTTKFSRTIETDLAEYGFSLLRASLSLKEKNGDAALINKGFEVAGRSFESLLTNSQQKYLDKGFLQIIAASSYHLAGFSAIAFSILNNTEAFNINPIETAVRALVLRDLNGLKTFVRNIINDQGNSDDAIAALIANDEISEHSALVSIVNISLCRALAFFDFALQTGNKIHYLYAENLIKRVIRITDRNGYVTLWWISRICLNLLEDLWGHSIHQNLPTNLPTGGEETYLELRKKFILTLYSRKVSEVELWPSQKEAAIRSTDIDDDLVVALPTSAGKTRIAEIAALVTLSTNKRIIIVTPLRALSAQTERSFRKTFGPLGFTISSLYGASGMSPLDEDALKERHIVIATPEKLDFALRNDSSILDDVGLIILDEGHMIGPSEREIRYEILVQRLLRRKDASLRRIVCLSAILPDGNKMDNFVQWLRSDQPGSAVKLPWRPTRQRFGTIIWQGNNATLNFDYRSNIPFINKFIEHVNPIAPDRTRKPSNLNEKTIFAAWKFASQGKRTLIFVTQANWVEKFGINALLLVRKGYLDSLLEDREAVARAIAVGEEWLGKSHPAVKALEIGMAVHHGGLPNPFLRELELLLSQGIIKVTVASPTLSQGLNINAAVLLVPYLVRAGAQIAGEEFANVAGRAGRAFVDMEGFVIHMIENNIETRKADWKRLITSARERNLSSGLFQIIEEIYTKLSSKSAFESDTTFEYLANQKDSWFPDAHNQSENQDDEGEESSMEFLVEKLDATVLGLIESLDSDSEDLSKLVEDALQGSLWSRQVSAIADTTKQIHLNILIARARLIWNHTTADSRRGHFAMGVGFDTGLEIDEHAAELETLLDDADTAAEAGELEGLTKALIQLAGKLLILRPFIPQKKLPENWKDILHRWVSGEEIESIGVDSNAFIEEVFSYKMVWGLEAIRMRRISNGWKPTSSGGGAAACLENGVPQFMMAMLIRAGLSSRIASIRAVTDGVATFRDASEMYFWLSGAKIRALNRNKNWPTEETYEIWRHFYRDFFMGKEKVWKLEKKKVRVSEAEANCLIDGQFRVLMDDNIAKLYTPDFKPIITLCLSFKEPAPGILSARVNRSLRSVIIERYGPGEFLSTSAS